MAEITPGSAFNRAEARMQLAKPVHTSDQMFVKIPHLGLICADTSD